MQATYHRKTIAASHYRRKGLVVKICWLRSQENERFSLEILPCLFHIMVNEPVLVDTGPLIAVYSEKDAYHAACFEQMNMLPLGKAYTCWPVITDLIAIAEPTWRIHSKGQPADRYPKFSACGVTEHTRRD